jgi:hypothetical protein
MRASKSDPMLVWATLACLCFASPSVIWAQGGESGEKRVAIVRDGESWFFDQMVELVKEELGSFAAGEYRLTYLDEQEGMLDSRMKRALSDSKVDVVYAAGLMATVLAEGLTDGERTKPIVGGALELSDAATLPISDSGTSTLKNYSFTSSPRRVGADLDLLRRLTGQPVIHVIIDDRLIPLLNERGSGRTELESKHEGRLRGCIAEDGCSGTAPALPGARQAGDSLRQHAG